MADRKIEAGSTRKMLEAMQKIYPQFATDKEINAQCLVSLAHVIGVVAAYLLHAQGEKTLEKAIAMVVTTVRQQAFEGDSLIRQKKALLAKGYDSSKEMN